MDAELRALLPDEHEAALDLWLDVWGEDGRAYFERYFDADPGFQDGDCLVAVSDGRLVSAVHTCRRRMEWQGRELLCGAIANVATRKACRRQGLSRALLRLAVDRMEAGRFDFSMLFTGRFGHYGALGWQQVRTAFLCVKLSDRLPTPDLRVRQIELGAVPPEVAALYDSAPHRPLHMIRPAPYFDGWTGWLWRAAGAAVLLVGPGEQPDGYAVFADRKPTEAPCLLELRARDDAAEAALLGAAARAAAERGRDTLEIAFRPQFGGTAVAAQFGTVTEEAEDSMMLRNVSLSPEETEQVTAAYATGEARFWRGDGF